jgi:hypothetical protein
MVESYKDRQGSGGAAEPARQHPGDEVRVPPGPVLRPEGVCCREVILGP